jgi:hypothetical protein
VCNDGISLVLPIGEIALSEESHAAAMDDDPPEIFVLDFIHSGGQLDFRPIPVPADTPDPEPVADPKVSSAPESAESLQSSETGQTESPSESPESKGPFASAEKGSPFEDAATGSQTSS